MYQVETSTAVSIRPANPAPGTPGWFSAGNPGTGTPATKPGHQWFNRVQAEFKNAIEGAGLTLDPNDDAQLFQAISALIAAGIGGISAKQKRLVVETVVFETGVADSHPVRWNAATSKWDRAYADGTANNLANGIADVTNSEVTIYGETPAGLVTGLTAGSRYFLTAAGALSTVMAADVVKMGIAKSATVLWVDVDSLSIKGIVDFNRQTDSTDHNNLATCASGGTLVGAEFTLLTAASGFINIDWLQGRLILPSAPNNNGSAALGLKVDGVPIFGLTTYWDGATIRTAYGTPIGVRTNSGNIDIGGGNGPVINSPAVRLTTQLDLSFYSITSGLHTCQFVIGSSAYGNWDDAVNFKGTGLMGIFYASSFSGSPT
ncbi:MAG: hypothetical protein HQL45_14365 [Alphaproteobacteria bacterium]|nr:hypothetical protein [Alphaproteobacteria bacterium]